MNTVDQCNLLKVLYQKKYYEQSTIRQGLKQSELYKNKLSNYRQRKARVHFNQNKQSAPQLQKEAFNKIYDFEYCKKPIPEKYLSYRQFAISKERKVKSVSGSRQMTNNNKPNNWFQELKHSTLHSTRSFYINILGMRKKKNKVQKSIDSEIIKGQQNSAREYQKPPSPIYRKTISEARRRTTLTVLKNRQQNKTHHELKRDDIDLQPWQVEMDEII